MLQPPLESAIRPLEDGGGKRSLLIIKDLDLYPQPLTNAQSPTLNSEEVDQVWKLGCKTTIFWCGQTANGLEWTYLGKPRTDVDDPGDWMKLACHGKYSQIAAASELSSAFHEERLARVEPGFGSSEQRTEYL